jgi:outer membrane lipoprotein-sorting protein
VLNARPRLILLTLAICGAAARSASAVSAAATGASAADILARSRATYAALTSYADSGEIRIEAGGPGGNPWEERHSFTTRYRAPRNFKFELTKKIGERIVIWCDGGDFQSWWSTTGTHTVYPKGRGHLAFGGASYPTRGAALQIAPLIFPLAGLQGALSGLFLQAEPADGVEGGVLELEGTELLSGRRVHRISGDVGLGYARTGAVTSVRRTTVWIDAESHLVLKVVEETPSNHPRGVVDRLTTTFEPVANPDLADDAFRFALPAEKR